MSFTKISIQATVHATTQKAWDCYTLPEHIIHWNFASPDWHCPAATADFSVGGKFSARMEAKDGSFGFDFEGIYSEIIFGEKLVYGLADGRQVAVSFTKLDDNTTVTVDFDAENENPIDMQRDGWQAILNNYKTYTEKG